MEMKKEFIICNEKKFFDKNSNRSIAKDTTIVTIATVLNGIKYNLLTKVTDFRYMIFYYTFQEKQQKETASSLKAAYMDIKVNSKMSENDFKKIIHELKKYMKERIEFNEMSNHYQHHADFDVSNISNLEIKKEFTIYNFECHKDINFMEKLEEDQIESITKLYEDRDDEYTEVKDIQLGHILLDNNSRYSIISLDKVSKNSSDKYKIKIRLFNTPIFYSRRYASNNLILKYNIKEFIIEEKELFDFFKNNTIESLIALAEDENIMELEYTHNTKHELSLGLYQFSTNKETILESFKLSKDLNSNVNFKDSFDSQSDLLKKLKAYTRW